MKTTPDKYDKEADELETKIFNARIKSDMTPFTVRKELASLLRDKARLDWLEENTPGQSYLNGWRVQAGDEESNYGFVRCISHKGNQDVRQAIDAAIKENNDK